MTPEIPDEIKNKINELYVPCKSSDYKTVEDFEIACAARQELRFAAEFGYSLSTQEAESTVKNLEREVDRLKGLMRVAWRFGGYDCEYETCEAIWEQFKTEHNL